MSFMTGKLQVDTPEDAVALVCLLLQKDRPTDEVLAAIDEHSQLLPGGFAKVRDQLAAGNRGAASMQMQIALDPRPR